MATQQIKYLGRTQLVWVREVRKKLVLLQEFKELHLIHQVAILIKIKLIFNLAKCLIVCKQRIYQNWQV